MNILYVGPPGETSAEIRETISDAGHAVGACDSIETLRERLENMAALDGMVTRNSLPDGTGLDAVEATRAVFPDTVCVLFTDAGFDEINTEALGNTVVEYIDSELPGATEELVDVLDYGIESQTQTAYPLPDEEETRLSALQRYADDPEELDASFDRLTAIAAALFDVDAATVGFLYGHEERFVGCHGTDVDRLDREDTVCTYTILDEGVTVISDTQADPRFAENDELMEENIRFYAGAPIEASDGSKIGVFCLFDSESRTFGDQQREQLTMLAAEVMNQLELRRRLRGGETDG